MISVISAVLVISFILTSIVGDIALYVKENKKIAEIIRCIAVSLGMVCLMLVIIQLINGEFTTFLYILGETIIPVFLLVVSIILKFIVKNK